MKKFFVFFFFVLLLLFLSNNNVWGAVGEPCTCYWDYNNLADPCKDPTPSTCASGETCECEPEPDPALTGASVGCYPGTCALIPAPISPPTGPSHGDCDPQMTITGCIAVNIHCGSGYQAVVSTDCLSCWCEATPGPGGGEGGSIKTAIGDIDPRNLQGFIQQLLNLALGVAGGIAFLLMLFGAFRIMTSSGDPEKMKSGSELITSALTGLLFIIFSVFLLKFIGVDILQIPGFGQ